MIDSRKLEAIVAKINQATSVSPWGVVSSGKMSMYVIIQLTKMEIMPARLPSTVLLQLYAIFVDPYMVPRMDAMASPTPVAMMPARLAKRADESSQGWESQMGRARPKSNVMCVT